MACHALNNMRIGERVLNVRRAVPHAVHKATSMGVSPEHAMLLSSSIPGVNSIGLPGHTTSVSGLPQATTAPPATSAIGRISRVLAIKNVIALHQLNDTKEIDRLVEEVKTECMKAGEVRSAQFYNSQVMVEFKSTQSAVQAMKVMQGRQYDGRLLSCSFSEATPEMKRAAILRIINEAEVDDFVVGGGGKADGAPAPKGDDDDDDVGGGGKTDDGSAASNTDDGGATTDDGGGGASKADAGEAGAAAAAAANDDDDAQVAPVSVAGG